MNSQLPELEAKLEGALEAVDYYEYQILTVWQRVLTDLAEALPQLVDAHARGLAMMTAETMAELPQEAVDDLRRRLAVEARELGERLVGAESDIYSTLKSPEVVTQPESRQGEKAAAAELKRLGVVAKGRQLAGIDSILSEIQRSDASSMDEIIIKHAMTRASSLSSILESRRSAANEVSTARSELARATVAARWPEPKTTR